MPVTVADIITCLDGIAPFSVAESWDNVGLLVGDQNRSVTSILVALDPTSQLLDEAIGLGADTVITHHPALFKPLLSINTADPTGIFLEKALSARLTVVACHTSHPSSPPSTPRVMVSAWAGSGALPNRSPAANS
jgi:putative NIF3 family GTP cyclohydrolase 1 type 2